MNLRRVFVLPAVALLALALAACGNKTTIHTHGETEGAYLDVGKLTYQVQISRELNPNDAEDKSYLIGLSPADRQLAPDEAWFGVFILVQNQHKQPQLAANDFEIRDTQQNIYRPVTLAPDNVFAYRAGTVGPGNRIPGQLPELDTAAASNPSVEGALLLFKVRNDSFQNRPLELEIKAPGAQPESASVDLDV